MKLPIHSAFDEYFETELRPALGPLEAQRKQTLTRVRLACAGLMALGLGVAWIQWTFHVLPGYVFLPFVAASGGCYFLAQWMSRNYVGARKAGYIGPLVRQIAPDLTYTPGAGIAKERFVEAGMFVHDTYAFESTDLIEGVVGLQRVQLANVRAEARTRRHNHTGSIVFFAGLYFTAELGRRHGGRTVILPDIAERVLGRVGKMLQSKETRYDAELVHFEDQDFEEHFVVYGTDPDVTRALLTPALRRSMVEYRQRAGTKLYFSFVDSRLHVAFEGAGGELTPKLSESVLDPEPARRLVEQLDLAFGLLGQLGVETSFRFELP